MQQKIIVGEMYEGTIEKIVRDYFRNNKFTGVLSSLEEVRIC